MKIEIGPQESATDLQNKVAQLAHGSSHRVLEEVFDELIPADRVVYIDRLELDLGEINPHELEKSWKNKLESAIRQSIQKELQRLIPPSESLTKPTSDLSAPGTEKDQLRMSSKTLNIWLFYLKKGYLPWWSTSENQVLTSAALSEALLKATPSDRQYFLKTIRHQEEAWKKIVELFPEKERQQMLPFLFNSARPAFIQQLRSCHQIFSSIWPHDPSLQQWWINIFLHFSQHPQSISQESTAITRTLLQIFVNTYRPILRSWEDGKIEELKDLLSNSGWPQEPGQVEALFSEVNRQTEVTAPFEEEEKKPAKKDKPEKEDIYIDNAGLILLHPFLAPLLDNLAFTKKAAFGSLLEQQKAILLLDYLVYGHYDRHDAQRTLNKILCRWPLAAITDQQIELDENEIAEADKVLDSVLEYWTALGSSSPQALQETYLQRAGKLWYRQGQWNLKIEHNTFDILLSKLPWGISVIKLPWMEEMIMVEWV